MSRKKTCSFGAKMETWRRTRREVDKVGYWLQYARDVDFGGLGEWYGKLHWGMYTCGRFQVRADYEDKMGVKEHCIEATVSCRCRPCAICQKKLSLRRSGILREALPIMHRDMPGVRFIFLTLTVRNCEVGNLRETLKAMGRGFHRLADRKWAPPRVSLVSDCLEPDRLYTIADAVAAALPGGSKEIGEFSRDCARAMGDINLAPPSDGQVDGELAWYGRTWVKVGNRAARKKEYKRRLPRLQSVKRTEKEPEFSYFKAIEVTRSKNTAHPHFHIMLGVDGKRYFNGSFLTQADWLLIWRRAMRLDYLPSVDVRAVRDNEMAQELAKYCLKPEKINVKDEQQRDWWLTFIAEMKGLRLVAVGGAFQDFVNFKPLKEEDLEESVSRPEGYDRVGLFLYAWCATRRNYYRCAPRFERLIIADPFFDGRKPEGRNKLFDTLLLEREGDLFNTS